MATGRAVSRGDSLERGGRPGCIRDDDNKAAEDERVRRIDVIGRRVQDRAAQPNDSIGVRLELGSFILMRVEVVRFQVLMD